MGGAGTVNGLLKANGSGVVSAAVAGTDYQGALTAGSGISISAGTISVTGLTNSNLSGSAGITDANLATISTVGKVSNSATTATSANTASAIVARDGSGNISINALTAGSASISGTLTAGATSLGNTTVAGTISATSFINSGGGSGFLKADGSVDNSTYLTISSGVAASGSYTPIITFPNTGNGQSANGASNGSINSATYMRIGNVVTVSVGLTLTTVGTGKIYISLPTGASTSLAQSFVGNVRFPSYQESGIVSIISVSPNYIAEATISTASSSKTNTVNISFQYLVQ